VETFLALVDLTFEQIDRTYLLSSKVGLDRNLFIEEVRRCLVDPPRIEDILPPRGSGGQGGGAGGALGGSGVLGGSGESMPGASGAAADGTLAGGA
jgi:hypothetical protein